MIGRIEDLLPIGSVITLKEGKKRLMIFGIIQSIQEDEVREYDYIGVPYPEGNIGQEYQYLFDHADVESVHFRGYEDAERQEFMKNLDEFYKSGQV